MLNIGISTSIEGVPNKYNIDFEKPYLVNKENIQKSFK